MACKNDSVFADGFQILADLQNDAPEDFAVLSVTKMPFRFHDNGNDIRRHRPVITTRADDVRLKIVSAEEQLCPCK